MMASPVRDALLHVMACIGLKEATEKKRKKEKEL
jgi:hypothetical protein